MKTLKGRPAILNAGSTACATIDAPIGARRTVGAAIASEAGADMRQPASRILEGEGMHFGCRIAARKLEGALFCAAGLSRVLGAGNPMTGSLSLAGANSVSAAGSISDGGVYIVDD